MKDPDTSILGRYSIIGIKKIAIVHIFTTVL